jgi:lipopolysaccharide/colanic/teichoic acid biosynthesis glycosyltransferase
MIALLFTGEHEVFYFQKRVGKDAHPFYIWKFATMLKNSEKMGTGSLTIRNDPRVTSVGWFLRKTKLNELPQIINVLLGSMSVVGPRPLLQSEYNAYSDDIQQKVYQSKPGITGIGSIVFRDEERILSQGENPREIYEQKIAPYKGELELWYQHNISFWVDIKIMILTFWVVIFPESNLHYKWLKNLPEKPDYLK